MGIVTDRGMDRDKDKDKDEYKDRDADTTWTVTGAALIRTCTRTRTETGAVVVTGTRTGTDRMSKANGKNLSIYLQGRTIRAVEKHRLAMIRSDKIGRPVSRSQAVEDLIWLALESLQRTSDGK